MALDTRNDHCYGIKESICDPTASPVTPPSSASPSFESSKISGISPTNIPTLTPTQSKLDPNDASKRFTFVDLTDGLWSLYQTEIYRNNPIIHCPIGGFVVFYYPNYNHDVVAMADETHYDTCDFTNSTVLSPASFDSSVPIVSYYHNCTTANQTEYVSCSIPGHCQYGQKVKIHTSATITTRDEVTGEWLIHIESLERVLRLMGRRFDETNGFLILDRGYQTEELAEQTLKWIWCGLDHCPSFADLSNSPTQADCEGAIYTLMGFVSRKRPLPNYDKAEEYYQMAIDGGGVNECAARSYLTKMYLDKAEYVNATKSANDLCETCGNGGENDIYGTSVRQAKYAFDSLHESVGVSWPTDGPCATGFVSSLSPSQNPTDISTTTFCTDSSLRFRLSWKGNKISRDCRWVANKQTNQRCNIHGVAAMCADTCGTCSVCADSISRFRLTYRNRTINRNCVWVATKATPSRCKIEGIANACRSSCSVCSTSSSTRVLEYTSTSTRSSSYQSSSIMTPIIMLIIFFFAIGRMIRKNLGIAPQVVKNVSAGHISDTTDYSKEQTNVESFNLNNNARMLSSSTSTRRKGLWWMSRLQNAGDDDEADNNSNVDVLNNISSDSMNQQSSSRVSDVLHSD